MAEIWFVSDTHFNHDNILKFTGEDGKLIRPGFKDVNHMNQIMVHNWNSVVRPGDKVYHLGDVGFKQKEKGDKLDELLGCLMGNKRLIAGNHDDLKSPVLQKHFEKISLWAGFKDHGFTASHIPLRLDALRDGKVCVHGHIHQRVMRDPGYINVAVERINYTPVHIEELAKRVIGMEQSGSSPAS